MDKSVLEGPRKITKEKIVAGLKFLAEHQDYDQQQIIDGLDELGCGFTFEDVIEQYPFSEDVCVGMMNGSFKSAAGIIASSKRTWLGRMRNNEWFLKEDNEYSVYHFIRVVTGDDSYTKEYVDSLSKQKTLRK